MALLNAGENRGGVHRRNDDHVGLGGDQVLDVALLLACIVVRNGVGNVDLHAVCVVVVLRRLVGQNLDCLPKAALLRCKGEADVDFRLLAGGLIAIVGSGFRGCRIGGLFRLTGAADKERDDHHDRQKKCDELFHLFSSYVITFI